MFDAMKRSAFANLLPFRCELLGFVAFRAWSLELFSRAMDMGRFDFLPFDAWGVMSLCSGVVALACVLVARTVHRALGDGCLLHRVAPDRLYIASVVSACVVGILGAFLLMLGTLLPTGAYRLAGVALSGAAAGFLDSAWSARISELEPERVQGYALALTALGSIVAIGLFCLPALWAILAYVVLIFASVGPLVARTAPASTSLQVSVRDVSCQPDACVSQRGQRDDRRALYNVFATFAVFSVVYYFMRGLMGEAPEELPPSGPLGNVVTAGILLLALLYSRPLRGPSLFRFVLPVTVAGFVLYALSPHGLGQVGLFISTCANKLFCILSWIVMLRSVGQLGLSALFYGGVFMTIKMFPAFLGVQAVDAFLGSADLAMAQFAVPVLICCLVLIVCIAWLMPERAMERLFDPVRLADEAAGDSGAKSVSDGLREAVDAASARFDLTPREAQVLGLLAQGRNLPVIMDRLDISKGTAHAHKMHVYQKLGVHGQQELIDLLHQTASSEIQ